MRERGSVAELPPAAAETGYQPGVAELEALFALPAYVRPATEATPASEAVPQHERCLSEADILIRQRRPDGTYPASALEGVHTNLVTAAKEAAMPYAVSTVHQELRDGEFMWLDQTPLEVALSGYRFHKHPAARERVGVEVAEAQDVSQNLRPGMIKVFISPRMTRQDATLKEAEAEHLAHDDSIRIHMLDLDESGTVRGKFMQSLLVRDVPLEAWTALLNDPDNIFGRSLQIAASGSALDVMRAHAQMELPEAKLPEGVVSIVEAVVPYIADVSVRKKVLGQLKLFRAGQPEMQRTAESIADRWLSFEVALANSLHDGYAAPEITQFVADLDAEWGEDMQALLAAARQPDGRLRVSRDLAAKLEQARQNTLWVAAAVVTGNEQVIRKLGESQARQIYNTEIMVQQLMVSGYTAAQIRALEMQNAVRVAQSGVSAGGGCPGEARGDFKASKDNPIDESWRQTFEAESKEKKNDKDDWEWTDGVCRVESCLTRPRTTKVGPCSVCKSCQLIFDLGGDPTKRKAPRPKPGQTAPDPVETFLSQLATIPEIDEPIKRKT